MKTAYLNSQAERALSIFEGVSVHDALKVVSTAKNILSGAHEAVKLGITLYDLAVSKDGRLYVTKSYAIEPFQLKNKEAITPEESAKMVWLLLEHIQDLPRDWAIYLLAQLDFLIESYGNFVKYDENKERLLKEGSELAFYEFYEKYYERGIWISGLEISALMGLSMSRIKRESKKGLWIYRFKERSAGGGVEYLIDSLPREYKEKILLEKRKLG